LAVNLLVVALIAGYIGFSALYTAVLKRLAVVDVLALATLYCARIFAGAAAIGVVVSPYLLAFSLFFFLSLALMKRHVALAASEGSNRLARTAYGKRDSALLLMTGVAAALASCALLALYINDASVRVRYSRPDLLWGVWLALLYGVLRGWLAANRGRLDEDLISAAIRDPSLWLAGAAVIVLFLTAY
jgi:4-hydroxybenzoate polyprenyltransferase